VFIAVEHATWKCPGIAKCVAGAPLDEQYLRPAIGITEQDNGG
jgi:hypothetical protein